MFKACLFQMIWIQMEKNNVIMLQVYGQYQIVQI